MDIQDFLYNDYKLKTDYLVAHFSRMWIRFNFFLAISSALFGLSFGKDMPQISAMFISIVGMILSILWAFFGGTDNYLARVYRAQVRKAHTTFLQALKESIKPDNVSLKLLDNLYHVGDVSNDLLAKEKGDLFHFRLKNLSATELAVVFPTIFLLIWCARLLITQL